MKVIRIISICLSFLISYSCNSQDYKKIIEKEFSDYNELIEKKEFDKSTNYLIPEFFDLISKSNLIEPMEQTYNNPTFEYEIINKKSSEINDSKKIKNKYYSSFIFSNDMLIKIKRKINEKNDDYKNCINRIRLSIEKSLGSENVDFIEEKETIVIRSQKNVYAISQDGKTNWKFLVLSNKQNAIAKKLLPEELTEGM